MRAKVTIFNPAAISATISVTMTLEQWAQLRKDMKDAPSYGPAGNLKNAIDELSSSMNKVFHYEADEDTIHAE